MIDPIINPQEVQKLINDIVEASVRAMSTVLVSSSDVCAMIIFDNDDEVTQLLYVNLGFRPEHARAAAVSKWIYEEISSRNSNIILAYIYESTYNDDEIGKQVIYITDNASLKAKAIAQHLL